MRQLVLFLFLCATLSLSSQSKEIERLQHQRKSLQKEIESTNRLYLDVRKQTTTILDRINLINKQIANRKKIIEVQNKEIAALDRELVKLQNQITELDNELKQKQEKYAVAIKKVMHKRQTENKIFFILSGRSIGEALRRMQYLKQYSQVQRSQAEDIKEKNAQLQQKKKDVELAKIERDKTLIDIRNEQSKLIEEERTRKSEMDEARGKQNELQKILQEKRAQADKLNREIERLIAEEVARKEREAREREERLLAERQRKEGKKRKEDKKDEQTIREEVRKEALVAEAEVFNLSNNFVANKGRLPMPVTGAASIISSFGVQKHSEWNVSTNNSGIDIQAQSNSNIRSIFDGEVSRIIAFPGYNNCVILRHGEYYTFYANIIDVYVKKGQKVKTGEALGKIYTDSDTGVATMHFQLWKKTTKLDPAPWLKR